MTFENKEVGEMSGSRKRVSVKWLAESKDDIAHAYRDKGEYSECGLPRTGKQMKAEQCRLCKFALARNMR